MTLVAFRDFFRKVSGFDPFPWQERLADDVLNHGWPDQIALPTGVGKSSVVLIWAYALAHNLAQPDVSRNTPMRLVYVVDRRLIIDAVDEQAQALGLWLQQESEPAAKNIASVLRFANHNPPLLAARARGGVRPVLWTSSPNQPAVLTSTVDQAGSRLLFRGYGLSMNQRPIHAGILGVDSLFIIDEAHLSGPFVQTLRAIRTSQETHEAMQGLRPLQIVTMSATPRLNSDQRIFRLNDIDYQNPTLSRRMETPKWIRLVDIKPQTQDVFLNNIIKEATAHALAYPQHIGAIVVNHVGTARDIFNTLRKKQEDPHSAIRDVVLLTGRMRAVDRRHLLAKYLPALEAQRRSSTIREHGMLWVVATQTIEVGSDFDFDILISENAPLDALRQRWGRLNRLGNRSEAFGIVVHQPSEAEQRRSVYSKTSLDNTWKWLKNHQLSKPALKEQASHWAFHGKATTVAIIDGSTQAIQDALDHTSPKNVHELSDPSIDAPILTWAHLWALSQTRPALPTEPDLAPFLHGKRKETPDVHVIWRDDIPRKFLERAQQDDVAAKAIKELLTLVNPSTPESLDLPVWVVKRWLDPRHRGSALPLLLDIDGVADEPDDEWHYDDTSVVWSVQQKKAVPVKRVWPGDTIVVPTAYGGVDDWGFNPSVRDATDVADAVDTIYHQQWRLREHTLKQDGLLNNPAVRSAWTRLLAATYDDDCPRSDLSGHLEAFFDTLSLDQSHSVAQYVARYRQHRDTTTIARYPEPLSRGIIILWTDADTTPVPLDLDDDDNTNYLSQKPSASPISLRDHSEATEQWVWTMSTHDTVPADVRSIIAAAGRYHDVGKLDPRFQTQLHDGNSFAAATASEPWAKSSRDSRDYWSRTRAQHRSGYPLGMRHEELSVKLLQNLGPSSIVDPTFLSLFWHVIGAHHGWGRPWLPVPQESQPIQVEAFYDNRQWSATSSPMLGRLSSNWSDQFDRLQAQWGFWGLAYLETCLRLADYQASATKGGPHNGHVSAHRIKSDSVPV